ncbi:PIN-like domain-containing protein [Agromyces sp. NPDC049794]|uniref:PIN-like domain-containing protein n=1 Tax=unclassified Agromyces TaxID=2639701 RepID=UPI0034071788
MPQDLVDEIWENGTIVLDANALLGLYEQTAATRAVYVGALESVQERLWLPHQVALEFHKNRRRVWDEVVANRYRDVSSQKCCINVRGSNHWPREVRIPHASPTR